MKKLNTVQLEDILGAAIRFLMDSGRDMDGGADRIREYTMDAYAVKLTWGDALAIAEVL